MSKERKDECVYVNVLMMDIAEIKEHIKELRNEVYEMKGKISMLDTYIERMEKMNKYLTYWLIIVLSFIAAILGINWNVP